MNPYGALAKAYWTTYRPQGTAALPDPEAFFTALGQEIEEQIAEDALDLMPSGTPGQDFRDRIGEMNAARYRAREKVLQETVYDREKEPGTEDLDMPPYPTLPSLRLEL